MIQIRPVTLQDAKEILAIYTPYVENTPITFELKVPSLEAFTLRIEGIIKDYPYFVTVDTTSQKIVGYAYAGKLRKQEAFSHCCEPSIYLKQGEKHKGIGSLLYATLEEALLKQNIISLYACITSPNDESIKFHEKHGYKIVGKFTNCGYKLNAWHDVVWMEKFIAPLSKPTIQ